MSDSIPRSPLNGNTPAVIPILMTAKDRDLERGEPVRAPAGGVTPPSPPETGELPGSNPHSNNSTRGGRAEGGRRGTVVRLLGRLAFVMLCVSAVVAASAAVWIFMGPIYLVHLFLVAIVAYFAAGGRLRWLRVAVQTAPRDLTAILRYARLLWMIRGHERKNFSVADIFRLYVNRHPNKVCFIYEDQEWTFQQIEDYSNKIATIFKTHGYRKGDAVALLLDNRPEYVAIWLGLSKLGIITALINTNLRKSSLLHSINVAECQALIYGEDFSEAIKDVAPSLNAKLALYRFSEQPGSTSSGLKEKDLAAILVDAPTTPPVCQEKGGYFDKLLYIYTSGTTGLPKAAVITNSRYLFLALGIHCMNNMRSSDLLYCPLPLYHSAGGVTSVGQALLCGLTILLRKKFSARNYIPDCCRYNVTVRYMFIASAIHFLSAFRSSDRFYTPLPLYHTAGGVMSIGQCLLHGSTAVVKKKFSASAYFSDCAKYKCTVAQYIGEMCRYVLAVPPKPEDQQHKIRMIFGNGLRPQIWTEFVDRFKIPRVAEFYGATEGNANIVNVDNTVGAIGFVSRIIPSVYPISIIRVNAEGEPIRNAKGLCIICEPNEPGAFIGKIIPNNPSRAFLGYVDKKASKSKVVYDVFTKGDSAFISGDILVADELGYLFFKDRTGDTFRWKGENVSTSEVEAVVSNIVNYRDCIVYGVEIHGAEGRAGMAAIYDQDGSLDIAQLTAGIKEQLPTYARPQFIRALRKIDLTGTFKLKKKDLQEEGYDPRKITDKLYYLDSRAGYLLLTNEIYDQIQQGKIRF